MRIGIDARSLQEEYPSGVSLYTRELIRALLSHPNMQHHALVLFCNAAAARSTPTWLRQLQQLCAGHRVELRIRTWPNKIVTGGHLLFSTPTDRWMFGDVDVILVDSIHFYPFRRSHVPYVVVVHDLSFERFPDCLTLKGRWWHRLLQPRALMRGAAHCVAVSRHTASDVQTLYGLPAERVSVVYPGLPPVHTAPQPHTAPPAATANIQLPKQYVLWCSTVEPRKNIETVLAALQRVRQQHSSLELVIAGAIPPRQRRLLQRTVTRVPMTLLGYVDDATKNAVMASAAVMVYPSLYEGFGFPPLEAQQHGVPVIVGANSSMPEVCGEGALSVDVHNVDALSRALHHILTDDTLRSTLQQRAKENVKRFSWQHTAAQILELLDRVTQQTQHATPPSPMNTATPIEKAGTLITRGTPHGTQVYLIHRPQYNDWSLPKGHIEAGETAEQAALRETIEETGLHCTTTRTLPVYQYTSPSGATSVVHMFECSVEHTTHPTDVETDRGEWLSASDAISRVSYPSLQEYLRTVLEISPLK